MPIESLEDVRVFRQIVSSGGISAAARVLRDNKNRVSQRLVALERALGVKLAHRTTRSLKLTEEGERFFEHSATLLEAAERTEAALTSATSLEGRVRVAVRSALGGRGLGAEFARLMQSAPNLSLQVATVDENDDLLKEGFDLAVQVGALKDSSFVATRLLVSGFVLAATRGYLDARGRPASPADLKRHQCIRRLSHASETSWALVNRRGRRVDAPIVGARVQRRPAAGRGPVRGLRHRASASRRGAAGRAGRNARARAAAVALRAHLSVDREPPRTPQGASRGGRGRGAQAGDWAARRLKQSTPTQRSGAARQLPNTHSPTDAYRVARFGSCLPR